MPRKDDIWENMEYFKEGAETTFFFFKGREYCLLNFSPAHDELPEGTPEHARIYDVETGECSGPVFEGYYFISAYSNPRDGKVYCFAPRFSAPRAWLTAHAMDYICSDDLIHWSKPAPVIENYNCGALLNTGVTFDGERYVMLVELRDTGKPFSIKFLESRDMQHWSLIDGALFRNNITYLGAGAIYYIPEDNYYYITYLNEFTNEETGDLNYDTHIARSHDLVHWERGRRAVLFPDYTHPILGGNGIMEINASDAEFIEINGRVKACGAGGNQLGVKDRFTCWYNGTMAELFKSFFK
ncbi:MAG: hypothetical protein J6S54_03855 [Lentisphaeria bacterium]|nr:hypothetical protein [Lentisphaeria bacterium]